MKAHSTIMKHDLGVPLLAQETSSSPVSPPSRLKQILLEHPDARPRIGRAVAALVATALVSLGVLSALLIWHVIRRGRVIRERLGEPRVVRLPDLANKDADGPITPSGGLSREIGTP